MAHSLLRHEQKEAISTLVHGSDLLAVLPTGFGKSLVFQLLIRVQEILSTKPACAIFPPHPPTFCRSRPNSPSLQRIQNSGKTLDRPLKPPALQAKWTRFLSFFRFAHHFRPLIANHRFKL